MSEAIRKIQMHSDKRSNNVAMYVISKVLGYDRAPYRFC